MAIIVTPAALALISFPNVLPDKICEQNEYTHQEECTAHDPLAVFLWHVAKFLDHYEAAFVVLLTLAIAGFTGTLWRSTSGLWVETERLAKLSADQGNAFWRAERPYIFLRIIDSGVEVSSQGIVSYPARKLFRYRLDNHGRTVAFLTELREKVIVVHWKKLPDPVNPNVKRGRQFPAGAIASTHETSPMAINLAHLEPAIEMLTNDASILKRMYFQGFVRYSDVFGRSHITGFLAQFVPTGNAWVLRGGDEYNYSRDEDPNTIPEWTKEAMES